MSKTAFLYPGQGVQTAGMGKDFYDNSALSREVFDRASETLELDMKELCFEKNDRLDLTEYTQAALVTTYLAITKELENRGVRADIAAGLSLGEYAAITAAGAMTQMQAVRLVRKRGILMQNTVPAGEGAMCAVLALDEKVIEQILEEIEDVSIANYNCPGQIVITGKTDQVAAAKEKLEAAGARRCIMLNVSGPFHSPLLKEAGTALLEEMKHMEFTSLKIPYITNVTAEKVTDSGEIKELLAKQVYSPVRWMQSMATLLAEGVDTFVEIGPGRTLAGFMKKIAPQAKVLQVAKWEDMEKVTE
ncbi:[acyl-carrier-protein] S-malonyltransferase [bacterium 1XD8-76]|nr:[acyl-carrier-protein] S-malonyltransferase [bacterium 1XD8-76]